MFSSVQGCLLRIEHCGESRSYLVDARFSKRSDAKAAVCLQAMSQGLGNYIRAIGKVVESKVTQAMRRLANEQIFPILVSESSKLGPNAHPTYEYERDKDGERTSNLVNAWQLKRTLYEAFGCVMRVALSPSAAPDEIREYSVPAEYRTKTDAKVSVVLLAVERGVVEFLRFRGAPSPPGYVPFLASRSAEVLHGPTSRKRKEMDSREADEGLTRTQRKKRKKNNTENAQGAPQDPVTRQVPHPLPTRPAYSHNVHRNVIPPRKNPHVTGPGGLVPISGPVQAGHPIGQTRGGPRDVGSSTLTGSSMRGSQDRRSGDVPTPPGASVFQGSLPPYAPMLNTRLGVQGRRRARHSSYVHHSSSGPFSGSAFPQTPSDQVGGATVYETPQFPGSDRAVMSNMGYISPYGTAAGSSQYAHYPPSSHFQPPSYYPQLPQVGEQRNAKRVDSAEIESPYSGKEDGNSYGHQAESSYSHQNSDRTWGKPTLSPKRAGNGDTVMMGVSRESRNKFGKCRIEDVFRCP
jgi:hypothetical protein